jgi:hypothetical protein
MLGSHRPTSDSAAEVRKVLEKKARCVGHCIASLKGAQRAPKGAKAASKVHTRPQTSPTRAHCPEAILRQMTPTAAEIVQSLLTDASVLATTAACQVWQHAGLPASRPVGATQTAQRAQMIKALTTESCLAPYRPAPVKGSDLRLVG